MLTILNAERKSRAGRLPRCRAASLWLGAVLAAGSAAAAGYHDQGHVSLSLGGSMAYSANYDRRSKDSYDYVYRNGELYKESTPAENYSDTDLSLSLSSGYFIRNHLELGASLSAMDTWYSSTNRESFSLYDGMLYAKYFFDNKTSLTPYLKAQGGMTWLRNGDYGETDASFGGLGGVELLGMGTFTWFAELSSLYTIYGGDITGSRWRNQIYLGITWYLNLIKKKPSVAMPPAEAPPPDVAGEVEQVESRWRQVLDRLDWEAAVRALQAVPPAVEAKPPKSVTADPLSALPPDVRQELMRADEQWKNALERIDRNASRQPAAP